MVLSYILGDNPLFKLAEHIFVGVSVGYAILVAWHLVIFPTFGDLQQSLEPLNLLTKLPPILIFVLLSFKMLPIQPKTAGAPGKAASILGSIALAFLIGVGAAVAIGGAWRGTLYPQIAATAGIDLSPSNPAYVDAPSFLLHNQFLSNIVIIIGTVGTFFYFTFTYRPQGFLSGFREGFVNFWAGMGRWVILITLGALFANTVSARIALLLSRIDFLVQSLQKLAGG